MNRFAIQFLNEEFGREGACATLSSCDGSSPLHIHYIESAYREVATSANIRAEHRPVMLGLICRDHCSGQLA